MSFPRPSRSIVGMALSIAALVACQGDDNSLPLPVDAGTKDASHDATAPSDAFVDSAARSDGSRDLAEAGGPDAPDDASDDGAAPPGDDAGAGDLADGSGDDALGVLAAD